MDSHNAKLRLVSSRKKEDGLEIGPPLLLAACVFSVLAAGHVALHVPKTMLAVAAGLFVICLTVFWCMHWHEKGSFAWKIALLFMVWVSVSGLLFGTAFHLDRSRWLYFQLTGYDVPFCADKTPLADASPRSFLAHNPSFLPDPDRPGHLVLPAGVHIVERTLVVPRDTGLTIEPGTTLRFEHGCSLISYSPIVARGTDSQPIRFIARDRYRKWGAVGIVGDGQSVFEHAHFENGRHVRVNGMDFYGTLSLIGSDVAIRSSRFERLYGKDAVYVRGGDVLIEDNLFRNIRKDGLDMDGGTGSVCRNRFIDCRDDGIELSQTGSVQVVDNVVLDARGGRIGTDRNQSRLEAGNTLGPSGPEVGK